jgi:enoyl-CoA hydratase/carnithine racemase
MTQTGADVAVETHGAVAVIRLNRPDKRNAVHEGMIRELGARVAALDDSVKAIVLAGAGKHFCAGLDLSEHQERDALGVIGTSRLWHRILGDLQFGARPVIAALHGAVIGGGLEIACAAHVRLAAPDTFYQLPEGQRGIFVGGGASVRLSRIIGVDRVIDMMLTGRTHDAEAGQTMGLSHELVRTGHVDQRALEVANQVAANAPLSNFMILQALTRIADMPREGGFLLESFATALTQTSEDARKGIQAFLEKRQARFGG